MRNIRFLIIFLFSTVVFYSCKNESASKKSQEMRFNPEDHLKSKKNHQKLQESYKV
jgi:hypothetical protein